MEDRLNLLVTGGTGSFGKEFTKAMLQRDDVARIVIFSRDELKQWEMQNELSGESQHKLRFFLGDVRDSSRLERACEGINTIIHAAALKQVPAAEYNPIEFIKTNIMGAENVILAALSQGVRRVVALSTDKASSPVNLYGATKLCSDKLFVAANNIAGSRDIYFNVVRYGNVMGSRGSVIPYFLKQARAGQPLNITDERMTRFNITLKEGVKLVETTINSTEKGIIIVPKIPSYRITDLADAIAPGKERKITGIRPGEKIHEEMITTSDSPSTYDYGSYYAIKSQGEETEKNSRKVAEGFTYNSGENENILTVDEIRSLIMQNVDNSFTPL
jgi:UDP-N-acetylglucosamine 4,6-dehydratase